MKRVIGLAGLAVMAAAAVSCGVEAPEGAGWLTDFEKAKAAAAEKDRLILVNFTGSDWCGWCKKLDAEVFSQAAFKKFASDNLVLLTVDTPMRRKLPADEAKQNMALKKKYEIEGFPTILLLDSKGVEKARTGYEPGGVENYVRRLGEMIKGAKAKSG